MLTARVGDLEAALAATSPDDASKPPHLHLHRPAATADVPVRTPRSAVSPSSSPTAAAPTPLEAPPVAPAGASAVKLSDYVARAGLGSHPLGAFVDSTATADAAAVAQPDSGRYALLLCVPFEAHRLDDLCRCVCIHQVERSAGAVSSLRRNHADP